MYNWIVRGVGKWKVIIQEWIDFLSNFLLPDY